MARYSKKHPQSEVSQEEAMRIARGTQRPGQTKEQTKLIAQGIQKGIEQYKKRQSTRTRELDRKLKKVDQQLASSAARETEVLERRIHKPHWLPWVLRSLSWLALVACWVV